MFKTIKPLAFRVKENLEINLYVMKMPERWVKVFYSDFFDSVARKKLLKTKPIEELLYAVSPEILYIGDFYNSCSDKTWIVSTERINKRSLFSVVKSWCSFVLNDLRNPDIREGFIEWEKGLCIEDICDYEEQTFKLTDENGYILDKKIFSILPNLVLNKISQKGIVINESDISFLRGGDKKIISDPLNLSYKTQKIEDYYSISINATIQTTPHNREPLILFEPRITRWVSRRKIPFEMLRSSNTTVYVRSGKKTLYPLEIGFSNGKIIWEPLKESVFSNHFIGLRLPEAEGYFNSPWDYTRNNTVDLYTNYRIEMGSGFTYVKSGMAMRDKNAIYSGINSIIREFACEINEFEKAKGGPLKYKKDIIGKNDQAFRKAIANAIDSKKLDIEIYYEFENPTLGAIKDELKSTLGIDEFIASTPELDINISFNRVTNILGPLEGTNEIIKHENRIKDVLVCLKKKDNVTACLVLLPFKDDQGELVFSPGKDPKRAIRAGFAASGRLTQFISPFGDDDAEHRVKAAVYDLYRQLGYVEKFEGAKKGVDIDYNTPITAIHVINYKKTPYGHIDRAMVAVTINQLEGKVFVECPALWRGSKLYWEASLAFQGVATEEGKNKFTKTRILDDIKSKVYELYNYNKNPHIMVISSNGTTRNVWKLLTDSELSSADKSGPYSIKKIWFYDQNKNDGIDVLSKESGLRIIRIRCNDEVPGYITPLDSTGSCESRSGLFKSNSVYYGIAPRPFDKVYTNSYLSKSKLQKPNYEFKVTDMIEIYPIYLKEEDVADHWVSLVNNYRDAAHQYKDVLKEPLPMHLASKLEEYIY